MRREPGQAKQLILNYIETHPGTTIKEVANAVQVAYMIARRHTKDLRKAGRLINVSNDYKRPDWRVTSQG